MESGLITADGRRIPVPVKGRFMRYTNAEEQQVIVGAYVPGGEEMFTPPVPLDRWDSIEVRVLGAA